MVKRRESAPFPTISDKLAPHDTEAEERVLGAIILDENVLNDIQELEPEHFADRSNAEMFRSCLNLRDRGEVVSLLAIKQDLEDRLPSMDTDQVTDFLRIAAHNTPSPHLAESHAAIVRSTAIRRQILSSAGETARNAYSRADPGETLESALQALENISAELHGRMCRLQINSLKKLRSEPPSYDISVNGTMLTRVPWDTLVKYANFRKYVGQALDFIPVVIEQKAWETRLNRLLEQAEKEEAPPSASEAGQIIVAIARICREFPIAESMDDMAGGRPAIIRVRDRGEHYVFRSDELLRTLRDKYGIKVKAPDLWAIMRLCGCLGDWSFRLGNRVAKGWAVPATLAEGMEELGITKEEEGEIQPPLEELEGAEEL